MRFIDLHEDIGVMSQKADIISTTEQSNLDALEKFEDSLICGVIFPHISTFNDRAAELSRQYGYPVRSTVALWEDVMEQQKFYKYLERMKKITVVSKQEEIEKRGIKILLSLEGTDSLKDPYDLYLLRDLSLRCIGLTWNYDTKFAASAMSKKDYGLTGYGEELVKIANEQGIIVDLAHSSKNTILDTCSITRQPVLYSHGNVKRVHQHVRNLDDESIEAIVKTGGVIGITAIRATLSKDPSIEDMVRHMEYIGDNFGWECVALGTDFLGIDETPRGFENVSKIEVLGEMLGVHSNQVLWENPLRVINKILFHL